jgi:PAS domain S-box-containing protein
MTEYPYVTESQDVIKAALSEELDTLCQGILTLMTSNHVPEFQLQLLRGLISLSQFAVQQADQDHNASEEIGAMVESLHQEVETLKAVNSMYEKQVQWLKDQEALSRTTVGQLRLKAILNQTLELALEITCAETGSIFLLGENRVILDCILMRQQTTEDERHNIIGRVLEKGLAGWVADNLTIGFIKDARTDKRWLNFPNQPYNVGSALCVPMMVAQRLVGILTVTHPEVNYFTQQDCDLLFTSGYQAALILDHDRLNFETKRYLDQVRLYDNQFRQLLQTPLVGVFMIQNNKFVHVNTKLAALLGYPKDELLRLQSIASVIAYEDRAIISETFNQCLAGKVPQLNVTFSITRKNGQLVKVLVQGITTQFNGRSAIMGMMDGI